MKHPFPAFLVLTTFIFASCNMEDAVAQIEQTIDQDTIWVYAQINVPEAGGKIDDYFYYGRISRKLHQEYLDRKVDSGPILFRDVRYWSNEDNFVIYEDETYTGDLVFRIEDIVFVRILKGDPLVTTQAEEESAPLID
ncbi:MAG: hypothetical protein AAF555_05140 [Verrucomicrobiota bacterium]